jgi:hypothetical protein
LATKSYNYFDDFSELGIPNPVVGYVTESSALLALLDEPFWLCLRAQPKREHLTATVGPAKLILTRCRDFSQNPFCEITPKQELC